MYLSFPFTRHAAVAVILSSFFIAPYAEAQQPFILPQSLTITLSPQYPAAGENVEVFIESTTINLPDSTVTWFVNDKVFQKGEGLTSIEVKAGELGTSMKIDVDVDGLGGETASAQTSIRPTEVALLWESNSYVPPFYRGRTSAGTGAVVRFQALPRLRKNGVLLSDNELIFTWSQNGIALKPASGKGRSTVRVLGPALFGTDTITLVVQSLDGTVTGSATAQIRATEPFVALYEEHPLFGTLFHRAIQDGSSVSDTEQTVAAVPYFAHANSPVDSSLTYNWILNNKAIAMDPLQRNLLRISTSGFTGLATVGVSLTSSSDWTMRATGEWQLYFGGPSYTSPGGASGTLFGENVDQ